MSRELALKSDFHFPKNFCFIFFNKSPFSNFCPDFFGHVEERVDKNKLRLISKCLTSHRAITMRILLNISRSKGNKTLTFGHLIECNVRKNFPQKYRS